MSTTNEKSIQTTSVRFGGKCACKRISYACTETPSAANTCHCVTCRALSGGPYQAFADVQSASVTFYDHQENLRYEGLPKKDFGGISFLELESVADRAFCASCHTPLAMRYPHLGGLINLTLGSVDEGSIIDDEVKDALTPKSHIFVSQKAWWVDVEKEGLPTYERFSGQFEEDMKAYERKHG